LGEGTQGGEEKGKLESNEGKTSETAPQGRRGGLGDP